MEKGPTNDGLPPRTLQPSPPRCRVRPRLAAVVAALTLLGAGATPANAGDPRLFRVTLTRVGSHLGFPTALAFPPDGRIFMLERSGLIRVRVSGGFLSRPYVDIRSRVLSGGEQGLLGMAFHPGFRSNGLFYLSYTDTGGSLRISRFRASPTANTASTSEYNLLRVAHPGASNHNAGQLAFGRDGYLYISTGDGGGGGDPNGNAQNYGSLLGKILRIDISHGCGSLRYCIPSTNPFVGMTGRRGEIWALGVRNAWKFSFDRSSGTMFIADVGQGTNEEITTIANGGRNLGWDCYEGKLNTISQYGGSYCSGRTFTMPVYQYGHSSGRCAIIGGYMYRGRTYASLMGGSYIFADYCTGEIWGIGMPAGSWVVARVYDHPTQITTFGESISGEIFMADAAGSVYRVNAVRR